MTIPDEQHWLRFPCECVSSRSGYSEPWAAVAQRKLLPDGTKEAILNRVARQPKTIAHLAKELGLSQPSVHGHVGDLVASELLRESPQWKKQYPAERYYEPNFPVVPAEDRAGFEALCQPLAAEVADCFEKALGTLQQRFDETSLAERGWAFADIAQCLYAAVQRGARELLEARGTLPTASTHANGATWLFWAEERQTDAPA